MYRIVEVKYFYHHVFLDIININTSICYYSMSIFGLIRERINLPIHLMLEKRDLKAGRERAKGMIKQEASLLWSALHSQYSSAHSQQKLKPSDRGSTKIWVGNSGQKRRAAAPYSTCASLSLEAVLILFVFFISMSGMESKG